MTAKKRRQRLVLDTNVFVRNFKSRKLDSPNRRIVRLWLVERRLQLVVSPELVAEYLEVFNQLLGFSVGLVEQWRDRFEADNRSTLVNLAVRYTASRDPDDNILLATARAGKAAWLVTNDRDLLDIPESVKATFPFLIGTPNHFLTVWQS